MDKNREPKNIIVRMPNWLGDLVMATPVLADLRLHWPEASITAMCQSNISPVLAHDPHIDELFSFRRPSGWLHREASRHILNPLQHGEYDMGILLTNSLSSAVWFWRGGVKNRIGYRGHWRSLLLDQALPFPEEIETIHLVLTYKKMLEAVGITLSDTPPMLYVTREEDERAKQWLKRLEVPEKGIIVGINPGAAYGSAKCWLPERFKELTNRLIANPNIYVLYFGDSAGAELVEHISEEMPERVINLAGKTSLRELMSLIELCTVFLTNDSGPMHVASALGTPLVALFGSTSDVRTGPYNGGVVIHKRVDCSPCYQRVCPIDFRCMKEITVENVYNELMRFLKR